MIPLGAMSFCGSYKYTSALGGMDTWLLHHRDNVSSASMMTLPTESDYDLLLEAQGLGHTTQEAEQRSALTDAYFGLAHILEQSSSECWL